MKAVSCFEIYGVFNLIKENKMNGSEIVAQGGQYAVGLGTLALLNAGLAQSKNRSGLLWFFISLPLGPLATLLLVAMEKQPEIKL